MIIPEEHRSLTVRKALELLKGPRTEVLTVSQNGAAIRDAEGNILSVTREFLGFTPKAGL